MKRKEIIELAKKNGMTEFVPVGKNALWEQIEVWVTMAVEAEREACAKVVEVSDDLQDWEIICGSEGRELLNEMAESIRARGEA